MVQIQHKRCKPSWLKAPLPGGERYREVRAAVSGNQLATVCSEARCPNLGECWNSGTATFMILGRQCTRGCQFCAVEQGEGEVVDDGESGRVAAAVEAMKLDYAVITSVTRDDLPDGGASMFAKTIRALQRLERPISIEVLTPDFVGTSLQLVLDASPTVFAHNIETVERLSGAMRHGRFSYGKSLKTLSEATAHPGAAIVKSSIMLGLGEADDEVRDSMRHLRDVGVRILVLGQYLQPTRAHAPVNRYVSPEQFDEFAAAGREMGFDFVAAAPLARTSYRAAEAFVQSRGGKSHPQ